MMKHALFAVITLVTVSFSSSARAQTGLITQEQLETTGEVDAAAALRLYQPNIFGAANGSLLIHDLPALTLLDGRRFPIAGPLAQMGMTPLDLFPVAFLSAVEVQKVGASPVYGSDNTGGVVNLRLNRMHSGGEVGVFYGKSGGKYGREDFQSYIIGGVGNDKFNITAGASYQESSGSVPRRR